MQRPLEFIEVFLVSHAAKDSSRQKLRAAPLFLSPLNTDSQINLIERVT